MEEYLEDLLEQGPYKRYFSDNVVLTMMGYDKEATGPDAVEQLIDDIHRRAFDARLEIKSKVVAPDGQAAEFDFVGMHTDEFAGIEATEGEVRVPYCVAYDLEGEKISRALRLFFPMDMLMRQLGVSSEPGPDDELPSLKARH